MDHSHHWSLCPPSYIKETGRNKTPLFDFTCPTAIILFLCSTWQQNQMSCLFVFTGPVSLFSFSLKPTPERFSLPSRFQTLQAKRADDIHVSNCSNLDLTLLLTYQQIFMYYLYLIPVWFFLVSLVAPDLSFSTFLLFSLYMISSLSNSFVICFVWPHGFEHHLQLRTPNFISLAKTLPKH